MTLSHEQQPTLEQETEELVNRNFTPDAQKVMENTVKAALRFNSNEIKTEHLLLGIIADPESEASEFLLEKNLSLKEITGAIEFITEAGKKSASSNELKMSPRLEKILILVKTNAQISSPGSKINDVHILMAIIQEGGGIAAEALEGFHVSGKDLPELRKRAQDLRERLLKEESTAPSA